MNEFMDWDGEYDKVFYDVQLANKDVIVKCWPNYDRMCATDGSGRKWSVVDNIKIRYWEG